MGMVMGMEMGMGMIAMTVEVVEVVDDGEVSAIVLMNAE